MLKGKATTLLLGLVLVAGCGGGGGDGSHGEAPTTNEAADAAPETQSSETTAADQGIATESTEPAGETPTDQSPEDLPFENGEGSFALDGERFEADFVVSCLPFDASEFGGAESHPDDLDVVAATEEGTAVQLEISYEEGAGAGGDRGYDAVYLRPFVSRSGDDGLEQYESAFVTGPDGAWYSLETDNPIQLSLGNAVGDPLAEPALVRDGNRLSGTAIVYQDWPEGSSGELMVSFDLTVPSGKYDCSQR